MQFNRQRNAGDLPIVWVTQQGRQTRFVGLYHPVYINVLYPAEHEGGVAIGPVIPHTRQQKISMSKEFMKYADPFFPCFLSVGVSSQTRNPGEIIIVRGYMKYFTELCKLPGISRSSPHSEGYRKGVLNLEIIDGVD
jgi:hypothetical protein